VEGGAVVAAEDAEELRLAAKADAVPVGLDRDGAEEVGAALPARGPAGGGAARSRGRALGDALPIRVALARPERIESAIPSHDEDGGEEHGDRADPEPGKGAASTPGGILARFSSHGFSRGPRTMRTGSVLLRRQSRSG
jgi:hypothetical protein